MALTTEQHAKIRLYLGYPDLWRYRDTRLEGILTGIQLSPEAEALISAALTALESVEEQILTGSIGMSGVKRVDEIEFFAGSRLQTETFKYGRMYVGRISITLGVPIYSDVFGTTGYLGDKYSAGGLGSRGGNRIPLG
jgi:hypothetical protein